MIGRRVTVPTTATCLAPPEPSKLSVAAKGPSLALLLSRVTMSSTALPGPIVPVGLSTESPAALDREA